MMGHGTGCIAAFLITAAVGYFVCVKANSEKKGSGIRSVGLGLGAIIIILGLLGSFYIIAKSGNCPITKKFMKYGASACQMHPAGAPPVCEKK